MAARHHTDLTATCETDACGGDVVGAWDIVEVCDLPAHQLTLLSLYCGDPAQYTVDTTSVGTPTGTATFDAQRVFVELAVDWAFEANVTSDCHADTCAAMQSTFDAHTELSVTCADDGEGGCDCTGSGTYTCVNCSSNYWLEGDTIKTASTFLGNRSGASYQDYCVEGDRAHMDFTTGLVLERQ